MSVTPKEPLEGMLRSNKCLPGGKQRQHCFQKWQFPSVCIFKSFKNLVALGGFNLTPYVADEGQTKAKPSEFSKVYFQSYVPHKQK